MSSIFTKIITREIPAHIIYEDEQTIAFLDINPVQPGHTLVIPKKEVDHLEDLDQATFQSLMDTVKQLTTRLRTRLDVERICVQVEGFDVPHAHVHLIPCNSAEEFHAEPKEADPEGLKLLADQLSS